MIWGTVWSLPAGILPYIKLSEKASTYIILQIPEVNIRNYFTDEKKESSACFPFFILKIIPELAGQVGFHADKFLGDVFGLFVSGRVLVKIAGK